jgi:hypothetical protein
MAENGVIFSAGVETDYLALTAGPTHWFAQKKATLVVPG